MIESLQVIELVATEEGRTFAPAGRMAAAIIDISQVQDDCLPQDLNAKGFTPAEITEHWHMARSLADVELKLMASSSKKLKFSRRG